MVMNADGSDVVRLTNFDYDEVDPNWSPDGRRIAFSGNGSMYASGGHIIDSDGSDLELMRSGYVERALAWSPTGRGIAFDTDINGNRELYVHGNSSGSATKRLTENSVHDASPSWSPDGRHIAFESNRDGNLEIYVMNADGSGVKRLTNNSYSDVLPSWQPGRSD